jgi:hypothetical protein
LSRARLGQRRAIELQSFGAGNGVFETKADKPHDREAIPSFRRRFRSAGLSRKTQSQRTGSRTQSMRTLKLICVPHERGIFLRRPIQYVPGQTLGESAAPQTPQEYYMRIA